MAILAEGESYGYAMLKRVSELFGYQLRGDGAWLVEAKQSVIEPSTH